jgi:hypothetical protein
MSIPASTALALAVTNVARIGRKSARDRTWGLLPFTLKALRSFS